MPLSHAPPRLPSGGAPIGIFDSGVGGLHVLAAIRRLLPAQPLIYLGDTARLPYGTKSASVVRAYARRCADFLLAQGAKMVVVACNTASAQAAETLAEALPVPVVGVIEAGAEAALAASPGGAIGVLATYSTLASGSYRRAIQARAPGRQVVDAACPLWVPLAEEDMVGHPATRLIVRDDLAAPLAAGVDTLILGCTHYPLLRPVLVPLCDDYCRRQGRPPLHIVEGAEAVARQVAARLSTRPAGAGRGGDGGADCTLFTTDVSPRLWALGRRLFEGPLPPLQRVDI